MKIKTKIKLIYCSIGTIKIQNVRQSCGTNKLIKLQQNQRIKKNKTKYNLQFTYTFCLQTNFANTDTQKTNLYTIQRTLAQTRQNTRANSFILAPFWRHIHS